MAPHYREESAQIALLTPSSPHTLSSRPLPSLVSSSPLPLILTPLHLFFSSYSLFLSTSRHTLYCCFCRFTGTAIKWYYLINKSISRLRICEWGIEALFAKPIPKALREAIYGAVMRSVGANFIIHLGWRRNWRNTKWVKRNTLS